MFRYQVIRMKVRRLMADKRLKLLKEDARLYFCPFILGNGMAAHALSAKIFFKCGISSLILSEHFSVCDIIDPFGMRIPLVPSNDSELLCEELIPFATKNAHTLPLLFPCDEKYAALVEKERERLEGYFIICKTSEVFSSSPLAKLV